MFVAIMSGQPLIYITWVNGYKKRYGLVYVDFEDDNRRIPKKLLLITEILLE